MRPFRFAVQGGPFDDVDGMRRHAQLVESLGYEELFSFDHVGGESLSGGRPDPFVPLVVGAGATESLRVGPLVLNNEFHQPGLLARTAASVDRMTQGRLVLGLGTGYMQWEHDALGMPLLPPGPRVTRFGECLTILRSLLDRGACTFEGEHHTVSIDELGVMPVQERLPFLIGGHGPRVVALAGRHADIFQFTGLTHAPDGTPSGGGFAMADLVERACWLADAAGDRNHEIERSALVQVCGGGDDAPRPEDLMDRLRLDVETIAATPFVLCGTLDQLVEKVESLRETLGISHFVIRDPEGFAPVVETLKGR